MLRLRLLLVVSLVVIGVLLLSDSSDADTIPIDEYWCYGDNLSFTYDAGPTADWTVKDSSGTTIYMYSGKTLLFDATSYDNLTIIRETVPATDDLTIQVHLMHFGERNVYVSFYDGNSVTPISKQAFNGYRVCKNGVFTEIPSDPEPPSDRKVFAGWYTVEAGVSSPFDSSRVITGDLSVYARWLDVYRVDYDTGNGICKTEAVVDGNLSYLPPEPSADHRVFDHWYTEEDGVRTVFDGSDPISSDLTVHAAWREVFDVVFNTGGMFYRTVEVIDGKRTVMPPEPALERKVFQYWYTVDGGVETVFDDGVVINSDTQVFSAWKNLCRVDFMSGDTVHSSTDVLEGNTVTLPSDPEADGKLFESWYTMSGGARASFDGDTEVYYDTVVYAKWKNQCSVIFSVLGDTYRVTDVVENGALVLPPEPVVEGKVFKGWFASVGGKEYQVYGGETVTDGMSIYSKMHSLFTVRFILDGDELTSFEVEDGEDVMSCPGYLVVLKAGHNWYRDPQCKTACDFSEPVYGDSKYYAKTPIPEPPPKSAFSIFILIPIGAVAVTAMAMYMHKQKAKKKHGRYR